MYKNDRSHSTKIKPPVRVLWGLIELINHPAFTGQFAAWYFYFTLKEDTGVFYESRHARHFFLPLLLSLSFFLSFFLTKIFYEALRFLCYPDRLELNAQRLILITWYYWLFIYYNIIESIVFFFLIFLISCDELNNGNI